MRWFNTKIGAIPHQAPLCPEDPLLTRNYSESLAVGGTVTEPTDTVDAKFGKSVVVGTELPIAVSTKVPDVCPITTLAVDDVDDIVVAGVVAYLVVCIRMVVGNTIVVADGAFVVAAGIVDFFN